MRMDFEPLGKTLPLKGVEAIDKDALETFAYEFPGPVSYTHLTLPTN